MSATAATQRAAQTKRGSADRACGTKRDVVISMSQTPAYRLKNAQNGYIIRKK